MSGDDTHPSPEDRKPSCGKVRWADFSAHSLTHTWPGPSSPVAYADFWAKPELHNRAIDGRVILTLKKEIWAEIGGQKRFMRCYLDANALGVTTNELRNSVWRVFGRASFDNRMVDIREVEPNIMQVLIPVEAFKHHGSSFMQLWEETVKREQNGARFR